MLAALAINIPALEDIHTPFWEKHLMELPVEGKEFTLNVDLAFDGSPPRREAPRGVRILSQKILLKPRPEKEMAMIEQWYDKTSKELFPMPNKEKPTRKIPSQGFRTPKSEIIQVKGEKYSQWHFIRLGNRYPADPNAPETWQGWKELEESITPSTMRDEIRLTRILIQYCDTKDTEVLEELKTWFAEMNETQRTCMARSVHERAKYIYGTPLLIPFRDLYQTICEYDVVAKSQHEVEWMKQQGLLE